MYNSKIVIYFDNAVARLHLTILARDTNLPLFEHGIFYCLRATRLSNVLKYIRPKI